MRCGTLSPWQRASNENMNGLLRDYFPKGIDLTAFTPAELERVERVIAGDVVATELQGGRRLSRLAQRLALEDGSTTLTIHG